MDKHKLPFFERPEVILLEPIIILQEVKDRFNKNCVSTIIREWIFLRKLYIRKGKLFSSIYRVDQSDINNCEIKLLIYDKYLQSIFLLHFTRIWIGTLFWFLFPIFFILFEHCLYPLRFSLHSYFINLFFVILFIFEFQKMIFLMI